MWRDPLSPGLAGSVQANYSIYMARSMYKP